MLVKILLAALGIAVALIALFIVISSYLFDKKVEAEIKQLGEDAVGAQIKTFRYDDLGKLPEPVQRYFRYVLKDGQDYIRFVRLKQTGEFRMNPDQDFKPFKAEQYFTTEIPGFIWKARLKLVPFVWIGARDMYYQGKGNMLIKMMSAITIADSKGKEMDQSTLLRFLAESPWFPTALFPSNYLKWEEIDSNSAKAIITDGDHTVSGVFDFNHKGEITRFVTDDRFMEVNGKPVRERWTTYYTNYQEMSGIKIPTEGETEWNLKQGDFKPVRVRVMDIQYNIDSNF